MFWGILVVFLEITSCLINCSEGQGPPNATAGRPGVAGPTGDGSPGGPRGRLPYCPLDPDLCAALKSHGGGKNYKGCGSVAPKGRQRRQANRWPYDCVEAARTYSNGQKAVHLSTQNCCMNQCQFITFVSCLASKVEFADCLQRSLQCIENCIRTHLHNCGSSGAKGRKVRPGKKGQPGQPGRPGPPGPNGQSGSKTSRCPVIKKKVGKSYCLERTCIPIN